MEEPIREVDGTKIISGLTPHYYNRIRMVPEILSLLLVLVIFVFAEYRLWDLRWWVAIIGIIPVFYVCDWLAGMAAFVMIRARTLQWLGGKFEQEHEMFDWLQTAHYLEVNRVAGMTKEQLKEWKPYAKDSN